MRPVLKPALRPCWRSPTTLQLGLDPARAVVLEHLDEVDRALLRRLDGLLTTEDVLTRTPAAERRRAKELLARLADAGALDDGMLAHGTAGPGERATVSLLYPRPGDAAAVLANRSAAVVQVEGRGGLGRAVTDLLAASGVSTAAAGRPTLLVLAPDSPGVPVAAARAATAAGQPHLVVRVEETRAVVGPHVLPGSSACSDCQGLARASRDPGWPLTETTAGHARESDARSPVLVAIAAALTTRQVLRVVDGQPPELLDATLELDLLDGQLRRRSWSLHPGCACNA